MGLISLIIPIFNAEKTLQRCLDSVRQQTYSNLEVILIDDGSTDGSRNICMSYTKRDSRFRYLYQVTPEYQLHATLVWMRQRGRMLHFWIAMTGSHRTILRACIQQCQIVI